MLIFEFVRRVTRKLNEGEALRIERGKESSGRFHFEHLGVRKLSVKQFNNDFLGTAYRKTACVSVGVKLFCNKTFAKKAVLFRRKFSFKKDIYDVSEGKAAAFENIDGKALSVRFGKDSFAPAFFKAFCNLAASGKRKFAVCNGFAIRLILKALCGEGGDDVESVVRNDNGTAELNADRLKKHIERVVLQKGIQYCGFVHENHSFVLRAQLNLF